MAGTTRLDLLVAEDDIWPGVVDTVCAGSRPWASVGPTWGAVGVDAAKWAVFAKKRWFALHACRLQAIVVTRATRTCTVTRAQERCLHGWD